MFNIQVTSDWFTLERHDISIPIKFTVEKMD